MGNFIENKKKIIPALEKAVAKNPLAKSFIYETGTEDSCAVLKVFYTEPNEIWDSMHNNMERIQEVNSKFARTGIKPAYINLERGQLLLRENIENLFISNECTRLEIVVLR